MTTKTLNLTVCVIVFLTPSVLNVAWGDEHGGKPTHIARLIRQLDDNSFRVRKQASLKLLKIGEPALDALHDASRRSSEEVRLRVRTLIQLIQRFELFTLSRDGRLFRLEVAGNHVKTKLIAKLGAPFDDRNVRPEGLAMGPGGALYAAVVFVSETGSKTRLYRIRARTGVATYIGDIAAAEVDGLDFGPDGQLYGAISSRSKALAIGLRQIVKIDMATGQASSTLNEVTFDDLDALGFDSSGKALVTNGSKGLFAIDLTRKNTIADVITDAEFRRFLRANDQMEGMCITREAAIFGLCHEDRTCLVRVDPKSKRVTKIGDLGFGALCLATNRNPISTKGANENNIIKSDDSFCR